MTAKEFRKTWLGMNPNIIHIPSEHELGLMEAYAQYYHDTKVKKLSKADVIKSVCLHEWDEGHQNVSRCKKCGKYSA